MTYDEQELIKLKALSQLMDSAFTIPGTKIRFGLDPFIGIIPILGDTIGLFISSYIVSVAGRIGVPWHIKARMTWNIFIDWLIGLVPFVGDLFDVAWKANIRNVALLEKYMNHQAQEDILDGEYTRIS